jgi:hypothetical protein
LSVVVVMGRAQSIPAQLKSARTVAIVNDTADPTALGMAHHFFVGSRFTCVDDRKKADLVLKLGIITTANSPVLINAENSPVAGNQTSFSVRNTFTLEVFNRKGVRLWSDSAELLEETKDKKRPRHQRRRLSGKTV